MRWDIFCRVIDNYGDAGVCWRLARDLANCGEGVRLFIDQPAVLSRLIDPAIELPGIRIHPWPSENESFNASDIPEVVIETFACDPPGAYLTAMAARAAASVAPAWINLEYLSAEDWVGAHHGLPSPHPRHSLIKHFYFPGFTPESGGLIREPGATDDDCDANAPETAAHVLKIYLFCYEQPAIGAWIASLRHTKLDVAPCPAMSQISDCPTNPEMTLTINRLPFVPQSRFDDVLRAHDLLFVRGEDSFIRAQWAGKPVFWHIYPQSEDAHLCKLDAFYLRYLDPTILTAEQREVFLSFIRAWNGDADPEECARLWPEIVAMRPALQKNALAWREMLLRQTDLVTQLRAFVADLVK